MARGPQNSSGWRWLGHWRARLMRAREDPCARDGSREDPFEPAARRKRRRVGLARRRERELSRELVEESEAFLVGRYVEHLESRAAAVPVWAWTNALAHGTADDLRRVADGARADQTAAHDWRAARAYVAAELLEATARGTSLAETQRQLLVPLELRLAGRSDVERWTPQRWVVTVRSSIARRVPRDLGRNGNTRRG